MFNSPLKGILISVLGPAMFCGVLASATADSIYPQTKARSMFADRKAHAVGDVITVLITESTVASQDAATSTKKDVKAKADGGTKGPFNILSLVPSATLGGSASHSGSGSTTRSSKVVSTMSCRIAEVTPSGQLILKGERSLKINADTQIVKLTGTIRPEDIDQDNTVLSGAIADAKIEVEGKGPIDQHSKPGILMRIFQFLF
jgi:flagellar L-ring protein precursor FlgH